MGEIEVLKKDLDKMKKATKAMASLMRKFHQTMDTNDQHILQEAYRDLGMSWN
jgi:prefoldin subunit 5